MLPVPISRMSFIKIGWLFALEKMFGMAFGGYINSENCKCRLSNSQNICLSVYIMEISESNYNFRKLISLDIQALA